MRYLPRLLTLSLLLASPALADPPDKDYVGAITYENGKEPERFACDRLDLVKSIYEAGKDNIFRMRPKFDELAAAKGVRGDPQCTISQYSAIKVVEKPVLLGPIKNPVGDAQLYFWAIHVDNTPKGGSADYWMLYLDTKGEHRWLQVGTAI